MKMFITIIMLLSAGFQLSLAQDHSTAIVQYLEMKDALIKENAVEAARNARLLSQTLQAADPFQDRKKAVQVLADLSETKDIAKQRKALSVVSPMIWNYLKDHHHSGQTLYYQYCPMKKAYWISREPEIKNPYYGQKMLNCGNNEDSLKVK